MRNVPEKLYDEIQVALKDIYRYERIDRYALMMVFNAAKKHRKIEDIFLEQAKMALKKHPVKVKLAAA